MLYSKKCPGCSRPFVLSGKPHGHLTQICPDCGQEVHLGDAKPLPEEKPATPAEEAKK